jgi:isopentenyl-diphosphate delta-isomerase
MILSMLALRSKSSPSAETDALRTLVECVDPHGNPIGTAPKLDVHLDGTLHRAISVFIFDDDGHQLLQQRALGKYHAPGLWSNSVCSHPFPGESPREAAHRRAKEELGMEVELCEAFVMRYRAAVGEGMVEHEYDHVFVARALNAPSPDPAEVHAVRWMRKDDVSRAILETPHAFTPWFRMAHGEVLRCLEVIQQDSAKVMLTPEGDSATFIYGPHTASAARPATV